ncbi:hypothetical protein ACFL1H_00155 [Nanoarchaeota archaeon]
MYHVTSEHAKLGSRIGDNQIEVIESYSEGEKSLNYIDKSAEFVLDQIYFDLAKNSGMNEVKCGKFAGVKLWTDGIKECYPDPIKEIEKKFLKEIEKYIFGFVNSNVALDYSKYELDYKVVNGRTIVQGDSTNRLRIDILKKGILSSGSQLSGTNYQDIYGSTTVHTPVSITPDPTSPGVTDPTTPGTTDPGIPDPGTTNPGGSASYADTTVFIDTSNMIGNPVTQVELVEESEKYIDHVYSHSNTCYGGSSTSEYFDGCNIDCFGLVKAIYRDATNTRMDGTINDRGSKWFDNGVVEQVAHYDYDNGEYENYENIRPGDFVCQGFTYAATISNTACWHTAIVYQTEPELLIMHSGRSSDGYSKVNIVTEVELMQLYSGEAARYNEYSHWDEMNELFFGRWVNEWEIS